MAAQPPQPIWTEPVRVIKAAHRGARRLMHRQARGEVAAAAAQVRATAEVSGIDLTDPKVRDGVAWVLLAVTTAPDRDSALSVMVELVGEGLDRPGTEGETRGE